MVKYLFREPLAIQGADKLDAQKVGDALAAIAAKAGGQLTPPAVVDAARDKKHLLHGCFEWRDEVAAAKYRLDQARALIRCVQVEDDAAEDGAAPAYVSISDKSGTSYRSLGDIKANPDLQAKVLAQAEKDLEAWQRRYRSLEEVCAVVRQAQEIIKRKRARQESRAQA